MIAVLIGTRPELIKIAPVIRRLKREKLDFVFIHSNQHYSPDLDSQIIKDLDLQASDYNLEVGSGTHAVQTGKIMEKVEQICFEIKPEMMIVHGDTNTALAGALTVKKLQIPLAHVESGLRSWDNRMPEEINRILIDRIGDLLFAPTEEARSNLLKEGISDEIITVTGNTIVDALNEHLPLAQKSDILERLELKSGEYLLITAHRPETVDSKERLLKLFKIMEFLSEKFKKPIVFPIHPRTKSMIAKYQLGLPKGVLELSPLGYIDMLALLSGSSLILTDSGGIQEEAYILKKPLITLRSTTERPESMSANFITDLDIDKVKDALTAYEQGKAIWNENVFGKGDASLKIVDRIKQYLKTI